MYGVRNSLTTPKALNHMYDSLVLNLKYVRPSTHLCSIGHITRCTGKMDKQLARRTVRADMVHVTWYAQYATLTGKDFDQKIFNSGKSAFVKFLAPW